MHQVLFLRQREDTHIIKVYSNKLVKSNDISVREHSRHTEGSIHKVLEGAWGTAEPHGHYFELKITMRSGESSFLNVSFPHSDLINPSSKSNFEKNLALEKIRASSSDIRGNL